MAATLMSVPFMRDAGGCHGGETQIAADVLIVSLGSTAGLRAAEAELLGTLRRAAADEGIAEHEPRVVVYSTVTSALLWPRPGVIRYDAPGRGHSSALVTVE